MSLSRYAFIVKAPGYSPKNHAADLSSDRFSTRIVGVSNLASAIEVAQQLVLCGVQLIELCGGFSEGEAQELRRQIGGKIPVGVVGYSDEQAQELGRLFG